MEKIYHSGFADRIDNLLNFLETIRGRQFLGVFEFLTVKKSLLLLKRLVLSEKFIAVEDLIIKELKSAVNARMGEIDKRILRIINEKGEASSLEIFSTFPAASRRGIKRNIANLLKRGLISRRIVNNNQTFYRLAN